MAGARALRMGLVINPFAGLGGPRARKGSDEAELKVKAMAEGWPLLALERTRQFLITSEAATSARVRWFALPGVMGGDSLSTLGIEFTEVVAIPASPRGLTDAHHTQAAVGALVEQAVDVLFFVGGDGTARDVLQALPPGQPALGVPAGVKMQSGVFAISPYAAAEVLDSLAASGLVRVTEAEVRDIDEAGLRSGRVSSRFFGTMTVVQSPQFVQHTKQGSVESEDLVIADIADYLQSELPPDTLLIVGPGSTTHNIMDIWGLQGTLLGVDLVHNGALLACDLDAEALAQRVHKAKGAVAILTTFLGGQGYVFGRGNQQITAALLRSVGRDNVWVVGTKTKLNNLDGRALLIDSGDYELDQSWEGYIRVVCGYEDVVLYPLACSDHVARAAAETRRELSS